MFQSVGLRDEQVRYKLNAVAAIYAIVIFGGFSLAPLSVLISKYTPCQILPVKEVVKQYNAAAPKANGKAIFIDYKFLECQKACDKANPAK